MRRVNTSALILGLVVAGCGTWGRPAVAMEKLIAIWADNAASEDRITARQAIAELRKCGPAGLDALFEVHAATIRDHAPRRVEEFAGPAAARQRAQAQANRPDDTAHWQRVSAALDAVGGQRDNHAAHLYWHTDMEEAKRAAALANKPILSLRLLGNLTDEFSCANSRFFRSTLYVNQEVGRALRERFVLHWQSVRPVPKVTIDFGDGRVLERTVTGNSIHYILDAKGQVLDALPGLYAATPFLRELSRGEQLCADLAALPAGQRAEALRTFHADRAEALAAAWQVEMTALSIPNAEAPTMKTDESVWGRLAMRHGQETQLDAASIAFIRSQNPAAGIAGAQAKGKAVVEDPLVRMVRAFQNTVAIDTVRNEYALHRQVHLWLADWRSPNGPPGLKPVNPPLDVLNNRVYAELFLTPSDDPWLGLIPSGSYSALPNNGVTAARTPRDQ